MQMPAYVVSERYGEVSDPEALKAYAAATGKLVAQHGGRYLTVTRNTLLLEGQETPLVVGIIEFPSMQHAEGWFGCDEYQKVAPLRRSATMRIVVADGEIPAHALQAR
jgi:uncharacterized protein (DUF1330 family)